ncbi:DnaJ (Hsp40), sub C, member 2 [Borealophlyctis nickersoniae]|nr:DnaJ (Hsp40), sub C, member 2 [Borealophlyctis nickersoniae]
MTATAGLSTNGPMITNRLPPTTPATECTVPRMNLPTRTKPYGVGRSGPKTPSSKLPNPFADDALCAASAAAAAAAPAFPMPVPPSPDPSHRRPSRVTDTVVDLSPEDRIGKLAKHYSNLKVKRRKTVRRVRGRMAKLFKFIGKDAHWIFLCGRVTQAEGTITHADFTGFTETQGWKSHFLGYIAFIPHVVSDAHREAWEENGKRMYGGAYQFRETVVDGKGFQPAGAGREWWPVQWMEPYPPNAIGVDISYPRDSCTDVALEEAFVSGTAIATGRMHKLWASSDDITLLILHPIYVNTTTSRLTETPTSHRYGAIGGLFRPSDVLRQALMNFEYGDWLEVHVYDADAPDGEQWLGYYALSDRDGRRSRRRSGRRDKFMPEAEDVDIVQNIPMNIAGSPPVGIFCTSVLAPPIISDAMATLSFLLPPPPAGWDKNKEFKLHHGISQCTVLPVEPVGEAFMSMSRRRRHKRTLSEDLRMMEALREATSEDVSVEDDEPESKKLLRSDPLKWKEQDHYEVLGISRLRHAATEDDIKRAYRRKVLKHHPDKKADGNDNFFKCIQKAWEVMSDPKKRREWDSVDPHFDESIPSARAKGDFFEIYGPVFEKESRFSKATTVPPLGDINSTREEVEAFYEFWFNFDSWRTFEMLDEEDTENCESREEKRYLERKNKAARTKLKKEDNSRVNRLVEQAFKNDPRIIKFKEAEKAAKGAKKREKELAAKAAEEEAKRKAEEEQRAKEEAEAAEKARQAEEKKEREAAKNAVRKEKKTIKRIMRDNNNFLAEDASADAVANQLAKLDEILESLDTPGLAQFRSKLEEAVPLGVENLSIVFDEEHMHVVEAKEAKEKAASAKSETSATQETKVTKAPWSTKETAVLIKAVKLYPGGSIDRWVKIAEYVNDHGGEEDETAEARAQRERTPKEAIAMSKHVQQAEASERTKLQIALNKKPVLKQEITEEPTKRVDGAVSLTNGTNGSAAPKDSKPKTNGAAPANDGPKPTMLAPPSPSWTNEQQVALEQAMRKYPAMQFSSNPSERWEKIAAEVPGKTKKEIRQRVKELAEMVKRKKASA